MSFSPIFVIKVIHSDGTPDRFISSKEGTNTHALEDALFFSKKETAIQTALELANHKPDCEFHVHDVWNMTLTQPPVLVVPCTSEKQTPPPADETAYVNFIQSLL